MTQTLTQPKAEKTVGTTRELTRLLANTYGLYLKTQNYHWNVTGAQFPSLHGLFEEQYKALAEAADEIAERLRALGHRAPGSFEAFSRDLAITEAEDTPAADAMVQTLAADHTRLSDIAADVLKQAEINEDPVSADLATQRMAYHQKTAWMLRSQAGR